MQIYIHRVNTIEKLNLTPTAVMTALTHAKTWEDLYTND